MRSVRLLQPRRGVVTLFLLAYTPRALGDSHRNGVRNATALLANNDHGASSYFTHADHAQLMYAHISLMVLAWVLMLPIVVMLSLARSRLALASRFCFLAVNALGLVLGTVYQTRTPDLYPNSAHGKVGWTITWIVLAQAVVSLMYRAPKAIADRSTALRSETLALFPPSADSGGTRHRFSDDSSQSLSYLEGGLEHDGGVASPSSHLDKVYGLNESEVDPAAVRRLFPIPGAAQPVRAAKLASVKVWRCLNASCRIFDRLILPFAFVALSTGVVTYGRLFEGNEIFSGLAHWIKGGVFFWLGLFTLGRWSGSFGDLGWAWNLRPQTSQRMWRPSAEFVESALIFFYGSTNIFLEHLGKLGSAWSSQDLEHAAITVLFIDGGLCGMLVESTRIRQLLSTAALDAVAGDSTFAEENQLQQAPDTYNFSLNPIPALVILLLGIVMSSHHQSAMISTMVHKQWGNLLLGASLARVLTYLLIFLRPPTSIFPSRPPTELLASFGLIAGGIVFMASSSDTIAGMVQYKLDAMFLFTITTGFAGLVMAWVIIVLSIKGWATRNERTGYRDVF